MQTSHDLGRTCNKNVLWSWSEFILDHLNASCDRPLVYFGFGLFSDVHCDGGQPFWISWSGWNKINLFLLYGLGSVSLPLWHYCVKILWPIHADQRLTTQQVRQYLWRKGMGGVSGWNPSSDCFRRAASLEKRNGWCFGLEPYFSFCLKKGPSWHVTYSFSLEMLPVPLGYSSILCLSSL